MADVAIIGGGIVGLMTAWRLHAEHNLTVIDAGDEPTISGSGLGATQAGCDARHVTLTETTTWTRTARRPLMRQPTSLGGWDGRPPSTCGGNDPWLEAFDHQAGNPALNSSSRSRVLEINRQSVRRWDELLTSDRGVFADAEVPSGNTIPILFTDRLAADADFRIEVDLDPRVTRASPRTLRTVGSLIGEQVCDAVIVPGRALRPKQLSRTLIEILTTAGCTFRWGVTATPESLLRTQDALVWATPFAPGVDASTPHTLGGVLGVWLQAPCDASATAFKLVGPEPLNYINITIDQNIVMASGGYSYVANHTLDDVAATVDILTRQLRETLERHVPALHWHKAETRACIRPSTPTGVPLCEQLEHSGVVELVVGAGCAGGFTHAPQHADWAAERLAGRRV